MADGSGNREGARAATRVAQLTIAHKKKAHPRRWAFSFHVATATWPTPKVRYLRRPRLGRSVAIFRTALWRRLSSQRELARQPLSSSSIVGCRGEGRSLRLLA